jgi:hypothetical protein
MYKELLDGSSFSLNSESDWRRLLDKKEVKPSKLTDYYSRQVQKFYEKRGQKLMRHINELVVSAYGKGFYSDKKRFTKYYRDNIKNHGKKQFLSRESEKRIKSSSSSPEINRYGGSTKMTQIIYTASNQETRDNSASTDKNSDLRFRRFGKNRIYYKRVVDLLLDYFRQVKEFAYKLNRHCYVFFGLRKEKTKEGWFQFKLMVYNDLMKILFRDPKVSAFLVHLKQTFSRNSFYSSRFHSIKHKLSLIEDHLEKFKKFIQTKINCEHDGKQIFQAVTFFKNYKKSKKYQREKEKKINKKNKKQIQKFLRDPNLLNIEMGFSSIANHPTSFDEIHKLISSCIENKHILEFRTRSVKKPTDQEIFEFDSLTSDLLTKNFKLSSLATPWFKYPIDCLDCGQRRSLEHLFQELEMEGTESFDLQLDEENKSSKLGQFPMNRISNQYSFGKSELIQDGLISNNESPNILKESKSPQNKKNHQTYKKKRKRRRKRKNKKQSASVNKIAGKSEIEDPKSLEKNNATEIFAQSIERRHREGASPVLKSAYPNAESNNQNLIGFAKENQRIEDEVMNILQANIKNQEVWEDTIQKLGNKRRKDERSRKKGRNKKLRMNEDLKALKAYLEWKEKWEKSESVAGQKNEEEAEGEGVWMR